MYNTKNSMNYISEILLRNEYHRSNYGYRLKVDCFILGSKNISISVVYLSDVSNHSTIRLIEERIQCVPTSSANEMQSYMLNGLNRESNIFHLLRKTKNINFAHRALANGDVIILIEGLKHVLVAPSTLERSLRRIPESIDSVSHSFSKMMNYVALFISVFISSFYIAALSIREHLLSSGTFMHAYAPFILPISLGVLILEVIAELMREAIWMSPPRNSFAIVALCTITVSQMLTRNTLFSPISVIVVIAPFLLSFLIPDYLTIHSLRILKFLMVIATGLFGVLGFVLFLVVINVNIVALKHYGIPYSPFGWYELMHMFLRKVRTCLFGIS